MAHLPRGIAPDLLLSQVKNTMPYLFESEVADTALGRFAPAQIFRAYAEEPGQALSHFEYFRLCVSAHYLTCATPVPTDVDNQIRHKLWPQALPVDTALEMSAFVLESRRWDFTVVTTRFVRGAAGTEWGSQALSGHLGEWFTIASAAYCALGRYAEPEARERRQALFDAITDEVKRHSEIFGTLWRAKEGIACLKAAASIAHNFGDLDRVMDMWELSVGDPLRLEFYKLGVTPFDSNGNLRYLGRLWTAGELYKSTIGGSAMAFENHRHFALRKPKCLRLSPECLIPTGPFFDDWGRQVARFLATPEGKPSEATLEVVDALKHGWERLPRTLGYGRALRGMLDAHPADLPLEDLMKSHAARAVLEISQERFERKWNDEALQELDDIPSRA
jgi:hypothetical protein